jgi:hypothetical protein
MGWKVEAIFFVCLANLVATLFLLIRALGEAMTRTKGDESV